MTAVAGLNRMFIQIARQLRPQLSMEELRDRLITQYLEGKISLDDFLYRYSDIMNEHGVEMPQGVIAHMESYASRIVHGK